MLYVYEFKTFTKKKLNFCETFKILLTFYFKKGTSKIKDNKFGWTQADN